ncbi:MAG TPA: MMPL family transporter [Geminicoccaceae bacterium]|nr:MMPL family transporter [Geminicoccaceae bacterium]
MSRGLRRAVLGAIDAIAARPRLVVAVSVLLAVLGLAYTLATLRIDTDTTDMISADVPFRQHESAFREAFPEFTNPIVAVIEGRAPERVEAAARALADALRADDAHFTAVDYPQGLPFFARNGLLYLEVDELGALSDRLAAAQPLLASLAADPSLRGLEAFASLVLEHQASDGALPGELDRLFGDMAAAAQAQREGLPGEVSWRNTLDQDGAPAIARQLVLAQPRLDYASLAPASQAIAALRAAARQLDIDAAHGLQLSLTGGAALEDEELQSAGQGALTASVLSTVAVAFLLLWGLRSWRLIVATLVTLVVGLIFTATFTALAIGRLNLISVTFAVLFVGVGVDFGIHVALRYQEKLRAAASQLQALQLAALSVVRALTLTAVCAALGFLSFVPTAYLGLAELGLISAFGMLIAWLTSLTLLPALLCLMPLKATRATATHSLLLPIERHAGAILAVATMAGLASLFTLPDVEFDFNPLNLKDPASESVKAFQALQADRENSPYVIDILAPSLAEADRIGQVLAASPLVGQTVTLSSFVPEAQDEKLDVIDSLAWSIGPALQPVAAAPLSAGERAQALDGLRTTLGKALAGDLAAERNPGTAALAEALSGYSAGRADDAARAELEARLLGHLPALLEDLRQGLEAGEVGLQDLPAAIRDQWLTPDGQARLLVRPAWQIDNNDELREFAEAVLAEVPQATGAPIVVLEGGRAVVDAFILASVLALALITLLLAVVLRSVRDILLVLAPILLATLLTAASAVLLGVSINFANVIVLPLLLGLGVSGAIHVVVRHRQHGDVAHTSTPRAVVFSTLTTIASFGSLAVSDHLGLASMGLLLTIAILWSMICCLVVLPAMLVATSGQRQRTAAQASDPAG